VNLLIGALTIGFVLSLLALGVYISFRIFSFADMTTDGSITLGAAVAAVLITAGKDPFLATLAAAAAGAAAGAVTGVLHTRFKIHGMLAGILVMTALYSVNLHVMGRSNLPLLGRRSVAAVAEGLAARLVGASSVSWLGWEIAARDLAVLLAAVAAVALVCLLIYVFFRTNIGTAMRATGDNPQMIRALGVDTRNMIVVGLALANALIALAGALLAQYQGFADVQMGIGMVVWGLASVIIGEALLRSRSLALTITGAVMGSVLFRLLVAIALRWGLDPNDLKLVTAAFVFVALILPNLLEAARGRKVEASDA
jgi:putative ABC transport system permease protein